MYLLSRPTPPEIGDLLFYAPRPGLKNIYGRLIARFTRSPICHVEIDMGNGVSLGAKANGVMYGPRRRPDYRVRLVDAPHMDAALRWARKHTGALYDPLAILSGVLRLLGVPLIISGRGSFTCSEYVAHFIDLAAGEDVQERLASVVHEGFETVHPGELLAMFQQLDAEAAVLAGRHPNPVLPDAPWQAGDIYEVGPDGELREAVVSGGTIDLPGTLPGILPDTLPDDAGTTPAMEVV